MIASIYARKSTEQTGVADEQKSVTRQIDHARAYAASKGWTVADEHVYVDDGISGAEFENRPGFVALLKVLKPAPFTVLIVSELSRLGREQLETGYALKRLSLAGVRVFTYLDDREVQVDTATNKFMMSAGSFGADLEREKARQRTYDAMVRKARAGHVTGGMVFGYDNVPVLGPDGKRDHVERRINDSAADVVRRIFQLSAAGVGQTRIAKQLNAEGAVSPRAQQGRPTAWAPSSVHEVLFRDLYRGVITWNRSRKRNSWGQKNQTARPQHEWMQIPAPALRIVSEEAWQAAHRRLATARAEYEKVTHGQRRPHRDRDSKYLLTGFGRCAVCGGGLHVRSRPTGHHGKRAFFYACTSHYNRGPAVCAHVEQWPMEELDREVLATITEQLSPDLMVEVIAAARQMFEESRTAASTNRIRRELAAVEREHARITEAIATGTTRIPVLVERLERADVKWRGLVERLNGAQRDAGPPWAEIERRMRRSLTDWRSMLTSDVAQAREAFRHGLLPVPIRFIPTVEGGYRAIRFEGTWGLEAVFGGAMVTKMASLPGFALCYQPSFQGIWRSDRRAA
jgi:DNA invertase Pin-like site-specific DNA recombinase